MTVRSLARKLFKPDRSLWLVIVMAFVLLINSSVFVKPVVNMISDGDIAEITEDKEVTYYIDDYSIRMPKGMYLTACEDFAYGNGGLICKCASYKYVEQEKDLFMEVISFFPDVSTSNKIMDRVQNDPEYFVYLFRTLEAELVPEEEPDNYKIEDISGLKVCYSSDGGFYYQAAKLDSDEYEEGSYIHIINFSVPYELKDEYSDRFDSWLDSFKFEF